VGLMKLKADWISGHVLYTFLE